MFSKFAQWNLERTILREFRVLTDKSITPQTRRILVEGITELLNVLGSGGMPKHMDSGICYNLKEWCSRKYPDSFAWSYVNPMIEGYSPNWFHYSGSPDFPIPGGESAYHMQVRHGVMWRIVTDSATISPRDYRIDLLRFLLARLAMPAERNYARVLDSLNEV